MKAILDLKEKHIEKLNEANDLIKEVNYMKDKLKKAEELRR